ncbi:aspartic peptidase domain-containing protein [Kockovaella imperatae]|uniref:Aspartic peptidase domain-containing protein n=1 Tax=Kockovaella imperatae TaxID=4999 RepID=A0A1Y1UML2_9TREE|nr:aspartic peptidase domain-containing protein [Kockovaella imperatae]ORX39290.1 aspartic peptidase domain-containing protein [Kockovaella imperatae]
MSCSTPSQDFLLIFDTGSSDMWVATTQCTSQDCQQADLFNPAKSSTFTNENTAFDITYGSGDALGGIGKDTVTIAGFTIDQVFGTVNQTSQGVIDNPISGILGFAWESIAQTGATPFWEELASTGQWSESRMGFFLQRYRGDPYATEVESQGGELTMGGLDSSKYTGNVNYITFPSSEEDYWRIPMQVITVQGSQVSGVTDRMSAIDTGTTLISGSPSDVQAIYAQIPNSEAMSQDSGFEGYYQYPCSTTVNVTLQFGGLAYSMSNADFNLGSFTRDSSMCTGAFFEMDLGQNSPVDWIVGASFLKNVYSVFQYDPPAIGFAQLSGSAQSVSNGTSVSGGSTTGGGTSGSNSTSTNGSGSGSTKNSGSAGRGAIATGFGSAFVAVIASAFVGLL